MFNLLKACATTLKISIAICLLCACKSNIKKHPPPPVSLKYYSQALGLMKFVKEKDSCRKAIQLLDKATSSDSNFFNAHYNKLLFLNELKDYKKCIAVINSLNRIKPNANDIYLLGGVFLDKIGDTTLANNYFSKSLEICSSVLVHLGFALEGLNPVLLDLLEAEQQGFSSGGERAVNGLELRGKDLLAG